MNEVKWIKIETDIFDDEKIRLIESMPNGDSMIVIWVKLLCLAGKQNRDGFLMLNDKIAYTDEMLAVIFNKPVAVIRAALDLFEQFEMIEIRENGAINISGWCEHQNVDGLGKIREQNRIRQQKSRDRKAISAKNDDMSRESNVTCHVTETEKSRDVTLLDKDIDIDKDIYSNTYIYNNTQSDSNTYVSDVQKQAAEAASPTEKKTRKVFKAPTTDDVRAYVLEKGYIEWCDPEAFVDFYSSKNWMVGRQKMSDWKAAVRNWVRRSKEDGRPAPRAREKPVNRFSDIMEHDDWDFDELERMSAERIDR